MEKSDIPDAGSDAAPQSEAALHLLVDGQQVPVIWAQNEATEALCQLAKSGPVTISAHRYGGFEQVGELPRSLPRKDTQITTVPGDIVLYNGNSMVLFYGSNTWNYTKLGHIEQTAEQLSALLDNPGVTLTVIWE